MKPKVRISLESQVCLIDKAHFSLKAVTLHMNPSSLTFTREMRLSADVVVRFTPRTTGQEIIHRQARVFLLSDLFLVCERMTPEEEIQHASQGADMWLCYPPLAGKVLRISDVEGQGKKS
jgi:hypothetical protein